MQALRGGPIRIHGSGLLTRSFCFVDELIEACVRLTATPDDIIGPMNLGNPVEFTLREPAETVIRLTGTQSRLGLLPLPSDDPVQRQPETALARRVLAWESVVCLEEGLPRTIQSFEGPLRAGLLGGDHDVTSGA